MGSAILVESEDEEVSEVVVVVDRDEEVAVVVKSPWFHRMEIACVWTMRRSTVPVAVTRFTLAGSGIVMYTPVNVARSVLRQYSFVRVSVMSPKRVKPLFRSARSATGQQNPDFDGPRVHR